MTDFSQLFRTIGAAAPVNNFGEYLRAGRHVLELLTYQVKRTQEQQTIIAAEFVVLATEPLSGERPHSVGEIVSAHWRMTGLTKDWQVKKEMSKARAFVIALLDAGATIAQMQARSAAEAEAWVQSEGVKLAGLDQPGRGRIVVALGAAPTYSKDAEKAAKQRAEGKGFVELTFNAMPGANEPAMVAQRRAALDQQYGPPQLQLAAGAAPAPTGPSYGHAMQPAPVPAPPAQYAQYPGGPAPAPAPVAPTPVPYGYGASAPAPAPSVTMPAMPAGAMAPWMVPGAAPAPDPAAAPAPAGILPPGWGQR